MRLRHIEEVSFRQSEITNFLEWKKTRKKEALRLGEDDVIAFVSMTGNQIVFIHGFEALQSEGRIVRVLSTRRLRVEGGTWNPLMLKNYAEKVGLRLDGLKWFEEYYKAARRAA